MEHLAGGSLSWPGSLRLECVEQKYLASWHDLILFNHDS